MSSYFSEVVCLVSFLVLQRWWDNDLRFRDSRHWYPLRMGTKGLEGGGEDKSGTCQTRGQ